VATVARESVIHHQVATVARESVFYSQQRLVNSKVKVEKETES